MEKRSIESKNAVAIGPYSHAVEIDGFVYFSGQTPIDPETGKLVEEDITIQTRQCFSNLFNVLESAGLKKEHIIKVNVYLRHMKQFSAMNEVYKNQFNEPYPARTTIGVAELPMDALVEIEMIAKK